MWLKCGAISQNRGEFVYAISSRTGAGFENAFAATEANATASGQDFSHRVAPGAQESGRAVAPAGDSTDPGGHGRGGASVLKQSTEAAVPPAWHPEQEKGAFRHLVERAAVGVLIVDGSSMVYANAEAARIFGYASAEELAAVGDVELLLPESDRAGLRRISAALLAGRRTLPVYDAIGVRADGSEIEVEVRPSATKWSGEPALCATVVDISRRRQAEALAHSQIAELAHFDRICTLGQMSATIMHEIAQPLTALSVAGGALQRLLSQPSPKTEAAVRVAESISTEARRMRDTIDRIKQFASGHARFGQEKWEVIDVADAIQQAFLLTAPSFDAAGVELELRLETEPASRRVLADQVQLGQVIVNLATNALDSIVASGTADGRVIVRVRSAGEGIVVDVIDNGGGIAPEHAERVFHPFFSTKAKGVGIGLAVCRSIVEAFGGSLRHRPAAGGNGAVFRLRLPLAGRE